MTLYKGIFNYYCELHILYTHAKNKDKAFNNFIMQLAKLLKVSRGKVSIYFSNEKKDNWKIKEIKYEKSTKNSKTTAEA